MTPDIAVILTDAARRIIWVNEEFTQITGYTLSEVLGRKPSILQGPKSSRETIQRIRKGLENKLPVKDEITNYRKNGEEYLCKLVIHPIFNLEQELTNYIAFEVDGNVVTDETDIPLLQLDEKYSSSSLKGVEEMKLYFQLRDLVEKEALYLDPDLTLRMVAEKLRTNTKYLSQVVNHHAGVNFQRFLNAYRIEAAKDSICSDQYEKLTLYGIARQCGFRNKSTFYKVFKEIVGTTPKKYWRRCRRKSDNGQLT